MPLGRLVGQADPDEAPVSELVLQRVHQEVLSGLVRDRHQVTGRARFTLHLRRLELAVVRDLEAVAAAAEHPEVVIVRRIDGTVANVVAGGQGWGSRTENAEYSDNNNNNNNNNEL